MRVDQLLCAAGPVDAVTNQGLAWRRVFDSWGWTGTDCAEVLAAGIDRRAVRPLRAHEPGAADVLLVHYSGYAPRLAPLVDRARRSLLVSHNITPARYFWAHEPFEGVRCALGPGQLTALARAATAATGVSQFNADALRAAGVETVDPVPCLVDPIRLPAAAPGAPAGPPTVLFVGRLSPHKRQDLVISAFARYRDRHAPGARLRLVGVPISPAHLQRLHEQAEREAPGAVTFEQDLTREQLAARYAEAHAFLCLSEHEGFCIPLLEALHAGVPVIARRAAAVPEVLGDAGLLLGEDDGLCVVAELLHLAVTDTALRAELRERGARRLETYRPDHVTAAMRARIEAVAA